MHDDFSSLPIIDVASLVTDGVEKQRAAARIDAACRQSGFFYVTGHGVHIFQGTYGDYLLGKVGKVFPGLKAKVL